MALKMLMLHSKLERARAQLEEERQKTGAFKTREEELVQALDEAESDEEIALVEEKVDELDGEVAAHEEKIAQLEGAVAEIEASISELEDRSKPQAPPAAPTLDPGTFERGMPAMRSKNSEGALMMNTRQRFFRAMSLEQRAQFMTCAETREFLGKVRQLMGEKRAISGAELTIPTIWLELLRDNLHRYSKLIKYVNLKSVPGRGRQTIMGTIPEGIWTEACAVLNELNLTFNMVEVDGYKVGGFMAICNATLEDSDINLANEILDALGQAIGFAVDKAIYYGTGVKMPIGFATRLAQAAKPAYWTNDMPAWKDLRATNLQKLVATLKGADFYAALIEATGAAKANYSNGEKFWAMNSTTYAKLMAKSVAFDAAGTVVAAINKELPIIGGAVEILEFIPDGDIGGGYGSLYLLAERAEAQLARSEHARFIEDQTVFKGTARYDGMPVISEGFVIININNVDPTTTVPFAPDTANTEEPEEP